MNFVAGTDWLAGQVRGFVAAFGGGLLLGCCWQAYRALFRPLRRARRNWLGPDIVFALLMLGLLLSYWFTFTDGGLRPSDFLWMSLGLALCLALPWPVPRRPRPARAPKPATASGAARTDDRAKNRRRTAAASPAAPAGDVAAGDVAADGVAAGDVAAAPALPADPQLRAATRWALRAWEGQARRRQRRRDKKEAASQAGEAGAGADANQKAGPEQKI